MFLELNNNPLGKRVGDCVIRAISAATGKSWDAVAVDLDVLALEQADLPNADVVWREYLNRIGWKRHSLPDTCPDCYTVADFAQDHKQGRYVLGCDGHVVCVIDGDWLDTWNSENKTVYFYWTKED